MLPGGAAEFEPTDYLSPVIGGDPDIIRRGLTLDVAGMVAEDLQYQRNLGEFMTPRLWALADGRNYEAPDIISTRRLRRSDRGRKDGPAHGSDDLLAREKADMLVDWAAVVAEREQRRGGASQSSARDYD